MARWFSLLVAVCAALFVAAAGATLWTDAWWFDTLGRTALHRQVVALQMGSAAVATALTVLIVGGSARIAASSRRTPRVRRQADTFDSMGAASALVTAVVAVASGVYGARSWPLVAQAAYGGTFDWQEPVFGLDAGFYVFILPLAVATVQWLFALFIAAGVVSVAHYVGSGTVRVQLVQQDGQLVATGVVMPQDVKRHFAGLCSALLVLYGVLSFLGRFSVLSVQGSSFAGPGYADLHGTLPMLLVQTVGACVAAVLVVVAVGRGSAPGFAGAIGLVVLCRLLTAVVPGTIQRLVVIPAEHSLEAPQIKRHLEATRQAWDLDAISRRAVSGAPLTREDLDGNAATLANLPLWDSEPLREALDAKQAPRSYYRFLSADADRYPLGDETRQVMVAPRELDTDRLEEGAGTWVNRTMTYTHGYGVVVSAAEGITPHGWPRWILHDVPLQPIDPAYAGSLTVEQPAIYFGETGGGAVAVGTTNPEFNHSTGDDHVYTRYDGADGVAVGSALARLAFAIRLSSPQLLLSQNITRDSKVLLYRNVVDRAARIAPMFQYDRDPYLVIHNGRLIWMLDGYTRSDRFPYSAHVDGLGAYARGSVKVTVDAYDGTVHFYRVDVDDPIADMWTAVFPDLLAPLSEMPAGLRAHLRYPKDLFAARVSLFGTYHADEPQHVRLDGWRVPTIGTGPQATAMPPLYTMATLPGEEDAEFVLTLPLTTPESHTVAAWVAARSDEPNYGQLVADTFPAGKGLSGPSNVIGFMESDPEIVEKRPLWKQSGSRVTFGPLLAVPIEETLLYVRVLYLTKEDPTAALPELKRVLVAHRDKVAVGLTLDEAVAKLFGAPPTAVPPSAAPPPLAAVDRRAAPAELVRQANQHWKAADAAARRGDWGTFGTQMQALGEVMAALEGSLPATDPSER